MVRTWQRGFALVEEGVDQSAAWYVFMMPLINWTQNEQKNKGKPKQSRMVKTLKRKIITHNSKWENRLPKYGSQSETTIDSRLWLGTIPSQTHRKENIEKQLGFLFLCVWPGMVLNQRQLSTVVSDWEPYLGSLFSHFELWVIIFRFDVDVSRDSLLCNPKTYNSLQAINAYCFLVRCCTFMTCRCYEYECLIQWYFNFCHSILMGAVEKYFQNFRAL